MALPVNLRAPDGSPANADEEHVASLLSEGYQLADQAAAPSVPTPASGRVNLIGPDGSPVNADASEVASLIEDGYRPASQAQVRQDHEAKEYGDLDSQFAAGAEGLAQGATMGIYGAVAGAISPEYERERRLRQQHNPITSTAAEIAGAVAPALLSGGTGAVGALARATPAAIEANLGTKLAGYLGGKAASWTASKAAGVAGRAVGLGLEGATDQAVRTVLDDAANGDVDVTAERMLDAAWTGFATGAALELGGAAIGAGIDAVGAGARKVAGKFSKPRTPEIEQAAREAAIPSRPTRPRDAIDSDLQKAEQAIADADAMGNPAAVEEAERVAERLRAERDNAIVRDNGLASDADLDLALKVETPEDAKQGWEALKANFTKVKTARELAGKFDETADSLTRDVTAKLDDLQRLKQNELDAYFNRSNKPKAIKAALEQEGIAWSPEQANRIISQNDQTLRAIEELRKDYALGDEVARRKLAPLKAAQQAIEGVQKHLTSIKGQGPISPDSRILRGSLEDIAQVFKAEDDLKSYLGQIAKKKGDVLTQAEATIQRIYMQKRSALQDPKLYGTALAEMQTVTNAIESKAIPAGRIFHNQFGRSKGLLGEHAGEHGFDELAEMDPAKIKALIKGLGDADSYKDETDFVRGLTRQIDLADAKAKYYPAPEGIHAKIAEARETVNAIIGDVRKAKILKGQRDEAAKLAREHEGVDKIVMALDALGAFLPGVHIAGRFMGAAGSAIKMFAGGADDAPKGMLGKLTDDAVKTQQSVTSAADSAVKAIFSPETKAALKSGATLSANAVQRAMERATALQDPNSPETQAFKASLQSVAEADPALAQALGAKVKARADFLASKMPPRVDPSDPLRATPGALDPATGRTNHRYVLAAVDPNGALERLSNGSGSAEDLETLRGLYPRRYQAFVNRVREKLRKQKRPPTQRERARLAYITGLPMSAIDSPDTIAWLQTLNAQPPEKESKNPNLAPARPNPSRGRSASYRSDSVYATRTDRVLSGE